MRTGAVLNGRRAWALMKYITPVLTSRFIHVIKLNVARLPYPDIPDRLARKIPPNGQLNIHRMLIYAEEIWPSWMRTGSLILTATVLPARLRELVIIRIGHLQDCPYEIAQHEPLARTLGVNDSELEGLAKGTLGSDTFVDEVEGRRWH